jgi:catechol 2,3-dioxygenase-like lactoylglutathione lyase family enzyme
MSRITRASTLVVPVTDQVRALDFYVGTLGFEKRLDFDYIDGDRWVEVAPEDGVTTLSLSVARDGEPIGVQTGVAWDSADVEADHAVLREQGADVDDAIMRAGDPVVRWAGTMLAGQPPMFLFRDPDGNSFLVVQEPPPG